MERTNLPAKMQRSRVPAKMERGKAPAKYTFDQITEDLSNTKKTHLLAITTDIQSRLINIKKDIYNIGELLFDAKGTLAHGMFGPWIKETFGDELPYPTAYFYMKVYDTFKDNPGTIQYIPTKYLIMMNNGEFPKEIIKALNEHPDKINEKGLQQINGVFTLFKEGKIGESQFLRLAKEQIKYGKDIWKASEKYRVNTNMRHSLYLGASDILKRIDSLIQSAHGMAGLYPYNPDNPEHKELMKLIDETIQGLQELKSELEGGKGLFKQISTKEGDKYAD